MHVHLKHKGLLALGAAVGVLLPPGVIGPDASRLLTTFMGFFTAGVLPTISILIGTVTASGRSVKALNDVHDEIRMAIGALVGLLKFAGATVLVMLLLSAVRGPVPVLLSPGLFADWAGYLSSAAVSAQGTTIDVFEVATRIGQSAVLCLALAFTLKAATLPKALFDALRSKHLLALDEARRSLDEKAPRAPEVKKAFAGGTEFGTVVRLDEKPK